MISQMSRRLAPGDLVAHEARRKKSAPTQARAPAPFRAAGRIAEYRVNATLRRSAGPRASMRLPLVWAEAGRRRGST
jgi:hypothetical protein